MNKGSPDNNMQIVLADLQNHPAVLERCQTIYLQRIAERLTYKEIAEREKIHPDTAWQYVRAYRKVAEQYLDMPCITDTLTFCYSELARLIAKRKETTTARDFKDLTGEIRKYQEMANELAGLTRKGGDTNINITYVQNIVNIITEGLPNIIEKHTSKEIASSILTELADQLEPQTKALPT